MTPSASGPRRLGAARLYALTPDAEPARVRELVAAWCEGGVDVVQLRHKTLGRADLLHLAENLRDLCRAADVLFFVNDHLDVAMQSGADGVHLGEEDLPLAQAERALGDRGGRRLLIGASVSGVEVALAAERAGADYLGAGPVFPTPIKPDKAPLWPSGVRAIQDAVQLPVFAIGGVDGDNLDQLRELGIDRVCVIRALSEVPEPEAEARRLWGLLRR